MKQGQTCTDLGREISKEREQEYKEAVENLRWPRGRLPGWLKANELGRGQKEEAGAP